MYHLNILWVTEELAQLVKCWPHKHEDLSSGPQNPHKSWAWQCVYNCSTGVAVEQRQDREAHQAPVLPMTELWVPWELSQKIRRPSIKEDDHCQPLASEHIYTWNFMHMRTPSQIYGHMSPPHMHTYTHIIYTLLKRILWTWQLENFINLKIFCWQAKKSYKSFQSYPQTVQKTTKLTLLCS